MAVIAFVLLTYREDHPSGIERAIVAHPGRRIQPGTCGHAYGTGVDGSLAHGCLARILRGGMVALPCPDQGSPGVQVAI